MPGEAPCAMQMLWNTQIIDTCIVFPQWHIRSNVSFIFSCLVIIALCVGYEWLRAYQHKLDVKIAKHIKDTNGKSRASPGGRSSPDSESHLLSGGRSPVRSKKYQVPSIPRAIRAVLYGSTIFFSFSLMLVFMTYNAYIILAVVIGASLGHYIFGSQMDVEAILASSSGKSMACH